jgi:retron-type reverse transcriptase
MKRHGSLWPDLTSFSNLHAAARKARRGKREHPNVARFEFAVEQELCRLQDELSDHRYQPGDYKTFFIYEPKVRLISAAPFRDRVVHHALYNVIGPIFERTFIPDSYACRTGKGTHAAIDRFTHFARGFPYVLKCDVQKYFPSIDHAILKELIRRKVKDRDVLRLTDLIIGHANPQEPVQAWFPGDDLFTGAERRRGLPLGNQTSQFFANVYLDPFDHFVKEQLRVRGYIRYVDDFVLFGHDPAELAWQREACRSFLARLRLRLHPAKCVISRVVDGTRFLGYRVFPEHRVLPKANIHSFQRRVRHWQADYTGWVIDWEPIRRGLCGWFGHATQADTFSLQQRLLADMVFQRGK